MTRGTLFYIQLTIFSFVVGIALRSFFEIPAAGALLVFVAGVLLWTGGRIKERRVLIIVAIALASLSFGILRMHVKKDAQPSILDTRVDTFIEIEAKIVSDPEIRSTNQRFVSEAADGTRILTYVDHFPRYEYGDFVRLRGEVSRPRSFVTDTGREFDWQAYLAKDDIRFQLFAENTEHIGSDTSLKKLLFGIKNEFTRSVRALIPEPESSLGAGILVGEKSAFSEEQIDAFRTTGIIHIIVLSGYNVTIVADSIMKTLAFATRSFAVSFGIVGIVLFAIMTGGSATIVRASIMAILVILAKRVGVVHNITTALLVAGFLMLVVNPALLIFDPSFQLSFLATVGLIYFAPLFEDTFTLLPQKFGIRSIVAATLSTQLLVMPLLIYMSGEVSLIAPVVNVLVLVAVPLAMLLTFIVGVVGLFSGFLGALPALAASLVLTYIIQVVNFFANFAFTSITISSIPLFVVLFLYLGVGIWCARLSTTLPRT